MKYETLMSVEVMLHHPSMSVQETEELTKLKANHSHNVGAKSPHGSHKTYYETYCNFVISDKGQYDPEVLLNKCSIVLKPFHKEFTESGGSIWIRMRLYDSDFIQLNFEASSMRDLYELNVGLAIENHS